MDIAGATYHGAETSDVALAFARPLVDTAFAFGAISGNVLELYPYQMPAFQRRIGNYR